MSNPPPYPPPIVPADFKDVLDEPFAGPAPPPNPTAKTAPGTPTHNTLSAVTFGVVSIQVKTGSGSSKSNGGKIQPGGGGARKRTTRPALPSATYSEPSGPSATPCRSSSVSANRLRWVSAWTLPMTRLTPLPPIANSFAVTYSAPSLSCEGRGEAPVRENRVVQQRAGRFGARLQPSRRHDQGPGDSHEPFKVAKARGHDGQTLAGREAQDLFALALPVLVGEPEPLALR